MAQSPIPGRLQDEPDENEEPILKNDEAKSKTDEHTGGNRRIITNSDLQDIFQFTGVELNANRMGRFSPVQQERLANEVKAEIDGMWLMLTILLGTAVLIAVIVSPAGDRTVPLVLSIGGVLAAFMFYSYRRQGKARDMADSQRVKQLAGTPALQMGGLRSNGGGTLVVGDRTLRIPTDQLMQLSQYNLPYMKLFYTQNGEQVISAEVLTRHNDDLDDNTFDQETDVTQTDDLARRQQG